MSVRIVHLDEVKAWNLIIQEDKAHKISEERKRTADPKDDDVKIAKEINTFGTNKSNALFNKIGEDDKDVLLTNKYTTTFILSEAIKYHFSYDNAREMRIIKEYLINFFNELFGILQEKYETIEDKEHYVYTDLRIFIGYITLAKKFYNRDTWEKELEALINSIDFSRDNSEWESLYLNNKKLITLKDIKRIEQYFDQLGGENNGTEKTGETA
jgi:hypothetical protein